MPRQEIPHEQWPAFLGNFALRHFGWTAKVEQQRPRLGRLIEAEHGYLQQLLADQVGSHDQIAIVLGNPFEPSQTHLVDEPTKVCVADEDELEINCRDGSTTMVHLREPENSG